MKIYLKGNTHRVFASASLNQDAGLLSFARSGKQQGVSPAINASPDIVVNTGTTLQTLLGWEAAAQDGWDATGYSTFKPLIQSELNARWLDLNTLRLRVEMNVSDMLSPFSPTNPNFAAKFDPRMTVLSQVIAAATAAGKSVTWYISYTDYNRTASPVGTNATTYANMMVTVLQHVKTAFPTVPAPDYINVWNEPDNNTPITATGGATLGAMMDATRAACAASSNPAVVCPPFIYPSCFNASNVVTYWNALNSTQKSHVATISFHRYQPSPFVASTSEPPILALGLPVSQDEAAVGSGAAAGLSELLLDLQYGNVAAWEQFAFAYPAAGGDNGSQYIYINIVAPNSPSAPKLVWGSRTNLLWQVMHYTQAGDQMMGITVNNANLKAAVFKRPSTGKYILVGYSIGERTYYANVPNGTYKGSYTLGNDTKPMTGTFTQQVITNSSGNQCLQIAIPGGDLSMPVGFTMYQV